MAQYAIQHVQQASLPMMIPTLVIIVIILAWNVMVLEVVNVQSVSRELYFIKENAWQLVLMDIGRTPQTEAVKYVQQDALSVTVRLLVLHAAMDFIYKIVNATLHAKELHIQTVQIINVILVTPHVKHVLETVMMTVPLAILEQVFMRMFVTLDVHEDITLRTKSATNVLRDVKNVIH
jgi:hypothetical protein